MKKYSVLIIVLLSIMVLQKGFAQNERERSERDKAEHYWTFQISEEEEQKYLNKISANLKSELLYIKEVDKEKYYEFLQEAYLKSMDYPFFHKKEKVMHETEKKIFELEVISESLSAKYGKAKEGDKKQVKSKLQTTLSELFDLREEQRKLEVEMLEKELVDLKKSLKQRLENKEEIVKRRIQELLGEDEYLDWD